MGDLKFGTSGLRGLVVDLEGAPTFDYTAAFLAACGGDARPGAPVLLGRDLRPSSPGIAASAAGAVRAAGLRPIDCGPLPTPALALDAMARGCLAVMVTGSHIPDDRNGLKFYTPHGEITKDDEAAIGRALRHGAGAGAAEAADADPGALERYCARCIDAFPAGALAGLRVAVYQQSTVARDLLVEVVRALGGEALPFGRAAGFVPVDTEAHRPEDVAAIRDAVRSARVDAVVTADGDGDRPLLADGEGRILPGDVVGTLAARHLGVEAVAVPVTCASAIEARGGFRRVLRTRVGSPFVIAGMESLAAEGSNSVAGFEANGGFLLGSPLMVDGRELAALPTRDAVLPILAVLASARRAGLRLSALAGTLGFGATASYRLQDVPAAASSAFLERLRDVRWRDGFVAPIGRVAEADDLDGVRLQLDGGETVHFRASGNAPELRCYAEAADVPAAERICDALDVMTPCSATAALVRARGTARGSARTPCRRRARSIPERPCRGARGRS